MRVLVLAPPLEKPGGIQRYLKTLIYALQELLGDRYVSCIPIIDRSANRESGKLSVQSKLVFVGKTFAAGLKWRPDLVICGHLSTAPLGLAFSKFFCVPYWTILYGIEAWVELPMWKRIVLRGAKRLIVISSFSLEHVAKIHQIDLRRIHILPCALDKRFELEHSDNSKTTSDGMSPQRGILTVARMASSERYKGHDVALRALRLVLRQIPNVIYFIVGDGDDRLRLEALTRELGLTENVVFTGEVTDSELVRLYVQSEIFLLPAQTVIDKNQPKGEGFGIVYLEAMAFAKPVIGPNCGAPTEFIRDGEHGLLVDPTSPEAVAVAITKMLSQPAWAADMGQAGKRWVIEHYTYDAFRSRLESILGCATPQGKIANAHSQSDSGILPI